MMLVPKMNIPGTGAIVYDGGLVMGIHRPLRIYRHLGIYCHLGFLSVWLMLVKLRESKSDDTTRAR